MNTPAHMAGFTLLEVMIAVVIFAIGLLGIAGLQTAGMRYTHGSQLRAVATIQAENMADRIRANRVGAQGGNYNTTGTMPSTFSTDCSAANCNPSQLATYDLVSWNVSGTGTRPREANPDVLPNGSGVVCIDSTPNDGAPGNWACDNIGIVYAIKVGWQERTASGSDSGDAAQGGANTLDTRQQRLVIRMIP